MSTQTLDQSAESTTDPSRRDVLRLLGAGLLIAVTAAPASRAQVAPRPRRGGGSRGGGTRGGGARNVAARVHIGEDGTLTVMTGKVECGQGARAELTQAAAEELAVPADRVHLVMADTALVPDDGGTAGSGSTPRTVPAIRQGCAAARNLLIAFAARTWNVDPKTLTVHDGQATDGQKTLSYAHLAADAEGTKTLQAPIPNEVTLTPVESWKVMGVSVPRPNGRDIVTGRHAYPSDIARPGMLYAKILRPPAYGAKLTSIDLAPAKSMKDVQAVHENDFVAVAAPTSFLAEKALQAIADTAKWSPAPAQPSSEKLYDYLVEHARGGLPKNPFADEVSNNSKSLHQTYHVPYVQHCPMEPRAAVAEWSGDKLTVWTGTQMPFGVKGQLTREFNLPPDNVRVIVPDFGGAFGGKHSGECAVEAARLARAIAKPVSLRWTREEEFTWAYFRPAGVIDAQASLDDKNNLATWNFTNVNSGGNEVQAPYRIPKNQARFVGSEPPLRHGSYRALAVTANNFARESFMDEMAHLAGRDPLEFRVAHLENPRLRAVLEEAAKQFDFVTHFKTRQPNTGVGLACGTDKGSVVAACARVVVDPDQNTYRVTHVCQAFECGKIVNPANLRRQVAGAIVMGLGPALREAMQFAQGKILNASFTEYEVPRFEDLPILDILLMDRPDIPSAGAGETPIIAIAPAIANALFHATNQRLRQMPLRLRKTAAN
jgi:isoquinoline 1-oxidoreductase